MTSQAPFTHFGSFDKRLLCFPPSHPPHPPVPSLSSWSTRDALARPASLPLQLMSSFLTFLFFLTSLLLFLSCSGSLLTRPNGRQLNQGLPSLPPREERPLVSPLPSISAATLFVFFLFTFISFSFPFLSSCHTSTIFCPSFFFSHVSVQKIGIFLFQNPVFSFRFSSRRYREL